MNLKTRLTLLGLILTMPLASFGQTPPPNDNYSNSITLTGSDVTFSGTLAGATLEDSQDSTAYTNYFGLDRNSASGSVWWNWTAPVDTVLTLELQNFSPMTNDYNALHVMAIYTATNGSTSPAGLTLPALGVRQFFTSWHPPRTLSVPVTAGTKYQIQFIGNGAATCTVRLVATNTPVIIQQPRSQTVSSNASALFYALYAGYASSNFTFQWRLNGADLPGETAPMLARDHIDTSMAGAYTVVISNGTGFSVSDPATLTVSQPLVPAMLSSAVRTANSFVFSVQGETGRTYTLESSTNLVNWTGEAAFPLNTPYSGGVIVTSNFYQTSLPVIVTVTNHAASKFFRVKPYDTSDADANVCINHLRQIAVAKLLWMQDGEIFINSHPFNNDIQPYFPHQTLPFCPDDPTQVFFTDYDINTEGLYPVCNINGLRHALTEQL